MNLFRTLKGVIAAVAIAGLCFWLAAQARVAWAGHHSDELSWLQTEFKVSDSELERIRVMHHGYKTKCDEMCSMIEAKDRELASALMEATNVSPAIELKLQEAASLRAQCQARMLGHFFEVSHAMPPTEGQRYMGEMIQRTCMGNHRMN